MPSTVNADVLFLGLTAKDLLIAGGWFFTIIGWLVSNAQANSRERRKEVRAEIDACIKLQADLVLKSRTYFGSPESDQLSKPRAAEIRFELQRLITRVERLEGKYPQFDVTGACGELMDAISGDPFESVDREALPADSDLLLKIESDTHVLIDQLEDGFVHAFG
ncbi:hypothetical protein B9Z51_13105 [Limnohabitans sp. T6-5]|uniref:hypothetical protein n=1 Tax=Limnohabitans sp. T6-5 TaxID=1100724 RepID=UPI000D3B3F50|nr:hypothetical protein [Limnohabitans sp. T6-5]PUE06863.1 hypothetical protein B9Z51_13105 [Limnohabitans sp. T6-5]